MTVTVEKQQANGTTPEVAADTLMTALLAVQAAAPTLPKDAINPHFRSRFTPLDTIVEIVGPLLAKHGLVWTTLPGSDDAGKPILDYRLIHASTGETLDGRMPLFLSKEDAQGFGSALTYARRYSITAVLNLVADDDDDGNAASAGNGQAKPKSATKADIEAMATAAVGLAPEQIKLALGACGIEGATGWGAVPKDKVQTLAKKLADIPRES